MTFTVEERRLIILFYSETRQATISAMWDALPHIDDEFTLAAAWGAIGKLGSINDDEFGELFGSEAIGIAG